MKTRELLQYAESDDPKVAAAGTQIRSGRKWSAKRELQAAEEKLRHKAILGSIAKGRAGLRFFPLYAYQQCQRQRKTPTHPRRSP